MSDDDGAGLRQLVLCSAGTAIAADSAAMPAGNPSSTARTSSGWSVHYASKTRRRCAAAASIFEVKNGEIHAYPTQTAGSEQPNAYLVTDADYKDYVISLEYKWGEKKFAPRLEHVRDAGLLYHVHRERPGRLAGGRRGADPGRRHRRFVGGVLAGVELRRSEDRAATRCPRTAACRSRWATTASSSARATAASNEYPGWNTLEVIVRGDRATHIVNGVVNMRVSDLKGWDAAHATPGSRSITARSRCRPRARRSSIATSGFGRSPRPTTCRRNRSSRKSGSRCRAKVTPGATPGARAVRCHRAVRRQEPRRLEERQSWRRRALEDRQRRDGRGARHRRHPDQGRIRRRAAPRGVVRSAAAAGQGEPGSRQQRHLPAGRLRSAGARQLREPDLRERHGGLDLQAVSAAGECHVAGRDTGTPTTSSTPRRASRRTDR